jgi:hypothetical protein
VEVFEHGKVSFGESVGNKKFKKLLSLEGGTSLIYRCPKNENPAQVFQNMLMSSRLPVEKPT